MRKVITIHQKKYSVEQFAELVGLSYCTISKWLRDKRDDMFMDKLGFIPKITLEKDNRRKYKSNYRNEYSDKGSRTEEYIHERKPRYHIVYKLHDNFNICVGFGDNPYEAKMDFFKSRKHCPIQPQVMFVSKEIGEAQSYLSKKICEILN